MGILSHLLVCLHEDYLNLPMEELWQEQSYSLGEVLGQLFGC